MRWAAFTPVRWLSFSVPAGSASLSTGCVTGTMTAVTSATRTPPAPGQVLMIAQNTNTQKHWPKTDVFHLQNGNIYNHKTLNTKTLSLHQRSLPLMTAVRKSSTAVATEPAFLKHGAVMETKTARTVAMNLPVREPRECVTPRQSSPARSQVESNICYIIALLHYIIKFHTLGNSL